MRAASNELAAWNELGCIALEHSTFRLCNAHRSRPSFCIISEHNWFSEWFILVSFRHHVVIASEGVGQNMYAWIQFQAMVLSGHQPQLAFNVVKLCVL